MLSTEKSVETHVLELTCWRRKSAGAMVHWLLLEPHLTETSIVASQAKYKAHVNHLQQRSELHGRTIQPVGGKLSGTL